MFNTLSNATNVTGRVLLSVALLVGSSSFAYGQVSESSYSLNGKTVNYIDNANESIEVISDNKLQSPDRKWSYIYDEQRRVISIEGPQLGDLDKTNIEYLDNGITKIITNPLGHKDIFEYDQDDRLISWIEPNGMKTTLSYGAKGSNPISFTSADGTTLSSKTEL